MVLTWFFRGRNRPSQSVRRRVRGQDPSRPMCFRPRLEGLEDRTLLNTTPLFALPSSSASPATHFLLLAPEGAAEETLSQNYSCSDCGTSLTEITPRLFSFNSPYGACPTCSGLGTLMGVDPDKVVPDPERSILAARVLLCLAAEK